MEQKLRCQSCGMPLGSFTAQGGATVENFGTDPDGFAVKDYCFLCYRDGKFVEPDLALPDMIRRSVEHMTLELGMDEAKAHELALGVIPNLTRWKAH